MGVAIPMVLLAAVVAAPALALDRPWISAVYFYWYDWNYEREWGGWLGGVYNTPLRGYYHSPSYDDNLFGLRQSAEWGITHHFMDYWGPGWQDDEGNPREDALMRATEDLQKRGYNLFMSFYQDAEDFDMAQFSKNLDPGRHCEFYVSRYGHSRAQPTLDGKPVYLIYGRNGSPKVTATDEGFRRWLRRRYPTVEDLNGRWGTQFGSFDEIKFDFSAKGHQRAESIKYQFEVWGDEMARANAIARRRFNLPGCIFSWDVGYGPFYGYGYADQARVFCGPHSYAGIFGVPHSQEVERFIQAAVAKRYGTVFFDTFKNFYHDWGIRILGACYPPDFCAFDRFWVQALSHYSEALLHLSWNEWWEGSNLEPDFEHGKTYCEKNLLYSTIMQQCFDSIRNWSAGARVAVLLNDWHWLAGGRHPEDIYAVIQALRRNNIRFDLIPDDFVTSEELAKFEVVVAPSGDVGFGYNAQEQPIVDILFQWAAESPRRKLIVDSYPGLSGRLGLRAGVAAPQAAQPGEDMTIFVDVGEEGDDRFIIDGYSGREDWGAIPPDKFGATAGRRTVRWTPAAGSATSFMLPFSPHRDHVLRLGGSLIWANHVTVLVDGRPAAEFDLAPDQQEYEVLIPATAVGGRAFAELTLRYAVANVPKESDPQRFGYEGRVCNFAIDWLQLATANMPLSREQRYQVPETGLSFSADAPGALAGKRIVGPYMRHEPLAVQAQTLSEYTLDGAARDIVVGDHKNILFVNGLLSSVEDETYLDALLCDWAGCQRELRVWGEDVIVTRLETGDTDILLAYNYAAPEKRQFTAELPMREGTPPLVELRVLSRDGEQPPEPNLPIADSEELRLPSETIQYYGVYQATRGWVRLETPEISLVPGETRSVELSLEGVDDGREPRTYSGQVRLISHIPSLTSDTQPFRVTSGSRATVSLALTARDDADWGRKTVVFDVEVGGRRSYFWRPLTIRRLPDLQVTAPVIDAANPLVTVAAVPFPWATDAVASETELAIEGSRVRVGSIGPDRSQTVTVSDLPSESDQPLFTPTPATLRYTVGGQSYAQDVSVGLVTYPRVYPRAAGAIAPMIVANPHDEYLENVLVAQPLDSDLLARQPLYVRERGGAVVPSQVLDDRLVWVAMLPPKSATLFYLCSGEVAQPPTDLVATEGPEGVTVNNSYLSLGWTGANGGTMTSFRSWATGRDYADGSFGVGFGEWGKYDPHAPAINTIQFVGQERKTWQREAPETATVRLRSPGPVVAVVEVEASLPGGKAWQRYWIGAYQNDFTVSSRCELEEPAEEIVGLDVRLRRNDLGKIFPNFTGIAEAFTGDHPSAGWREASYIPTYATMMGFDGQGESISVIPDRAGSTPDGSRKFRQGFWPQRRPVAGPVNVAEIELVSLRTQVASESARILLHSGHQVVAKRFRRTHVDQPPTVIIPADYQWQGEIPASEDSGAADWWNPYWHFRVAVTAGPLENRGPDPTISFQLDLQALLAERGELDPASLRAVVRTPEGLAELPALYDDAAEEAVVTLTDACWPVPAPAIRQFLLYFDTVAHGPKPRPVGPPAGMAALLLNGSFEQNGQYWIFGGGTSLDPDARTGETAVRLRFAEGMGPAVVSNRSMRVHPNRQYRVRFWAKSTSPGAVLRTNYYVDAKYDFPQLGVPLTTDGQWHQYECVLTTGAFPLSVVPALRFWVLGTPQEVLLDDVEVEPVGGAPQQTPVSVGPLEQR